MQLPSRYLLSYFARWQHVTFCWQVLVTDVSCCCVVSGDGNCLMNAVSLFIRARQDTGRRLRQTVYRNLSNHSVCAKLRKRWQSEREWQNANIPDGGLCYTDEVSCLALFLLISCISTLRGILLWSTCSVCGCLHAKPGDCMVST